MKNAKKVISRLSAAIAGTVAIMLVIFLVETALNGQARCRPITKDGEGREKLPETAGEAKATVEEHWLLCEIDNSVFLNSLETFSILVALWIFFLETPDRTQKAQYEAWQVVDAAHGLKTSYARMIALQDLNEDQISMKGLSAVEADLRSINLKGADLRNADLRGADLRGANLSNSNLSNADLTHVDFSNANLANACLTSSNLTDANFVEADLSNVDFVGAIITDTNFVRANLERAYFGDNSFIKTNLKDANLKKTKFFGVENLSSAQIKSAENWPQAIYDAALTNQLKLGE
ncbi:MAG: pentapeptide repeat-containing protein [Xenococcus sp. MO_188.B8]|nr:pentapeptide repeat-containing protein [Xenococcus sp. MO_188.B8]